MPDKKPRALDVPARKIPAFKVLALALALLLALAGPALGGSPEQAATEEPAGEKSFEEKKSEKPADEPAGDAKELTNTIRWATASEVDNFGFDVYRSESEDGPFEVLTEQPIEGAGTVDEPQRYVFVDDTIDPSKAYYYYVESISMSGTREQFTPIVRAKPKKKMTEGEEPEEPQSEG